MSLINSIYDARSRNEHDFFLGSTPEVESVVLIRNNVGVFQHEEPYKTT